MMTPLQRFLYERKLSLLEKERRAIEPARRWLTNQIEVIESILIFLSSQQTEEDMNKLKLTLDAEATPIDDIKPRQENQELTVALIELADKLKHDWQRSKTGKDMKYPLNNLPEDMKPKTVSSKIYGLRTVGKLPENIVPKTRTVREVEKVRDEKTGEWKEVVKTREIVYMVWTKNPPPVKAMAKGE